MTSIYSPALLDLRRTSAAALRETLRGHSSVAVLDFPSHMNVGDSMIWAGELAYLKELGIAVRYTADIHRFSAEALNRAHPDGPILMHGGGNLGDIWPEFQEFREYVVRTFPDREIVQLPQTLFFQSEERAAQTDRIFGSHPSFTLMLRDQKSMDRARRLLPSVSSQFVPDMALGWTPFSGPSNGSRGILVLARRDSEARGDVASTATKISHLGIVENADWGLTGLDLVRWKAAKVPGGLARRSETVRHHSLSTRALRPSYSAMLRLNLEAGIRMFSGRSLVVTDRLHAHVLAGLMGIPHVVLDNSYGKVSSIFGDYTNEFESAHFATDEDHAVHLANTLLENRA